jgi:hypothetical protein
MKTYKITLTFSDPYISSRSGGNKTLSEGLSLKHAKDELLARYNDKYADERGYATTWSAAIAKSRRYADGAYKTYDDGTRRFDWDSRIYRIEEEEKEEENLCFYVYDKEDTYLENECFTVFDDEEEARDFCINENAGYGYEKFYYKRSDN